ncbi:CAMK family protein kinase [Reticulomyxa filosa]|uniref:CAMK family protein kinase n=1 Tax=Reticulomyxa filosa TaxID=46433 RepID=X6N039_RETFI|nr:CAMK family protein kinase [Reticulomyxa filosa]|eukprot:ETO19268.1 CAMK family protein kinase [Reticulomyxa filosa]
MLSPTSVSSSGGGRVEERYEKKKKLSDTLQGEIVLGWDKLLNKNVIIKVAIKECVRQGISKQNTKIPENFENEKNIHQQITRYLQSDIRNGHIDSSEMIGFVTCDHSWEDDQCHYLQMEYCRDGDLFNYIAEFHRCRERLASRVDNERWIHNVQFMFRQLVYATHYLHSKRIVHRDLSLENTMMFDASCSYVKIIDFGLAVEIQQDPPVPFRGFFF